MVITNDLFTLVTTDYISDLLQVTVELCMKGLQTTPSHIAPRPLHSDYEQPAKTDATFGI